MQSNWPNGYPLLLVSEGPELNIAVTDPGRAAFKYCRPNDTHDGRELPYRHRVRLVQVLAGPVNVTPRSNGRP